MEETIYATIVSDDKWDSQDDKFFYKKYVFTKLKRNDLGLIESFIPNADKLKLSPFSFRNIHKEKVKKLKIAMEALSLGSDEINIKFDKKDSEVVREGKELYFFF